MITFTNPIKAEGINPDALTWVERELVDAIEGCPTQAVSINIFVTSGSDLESGGDLDIELAGRDKFIFHHGRPDISEVIKTSFSSVNGTLGVAGMCFLPCFIIRSWVLTNCGFL